MLILTLIPRAFQPLQNKLCKQLLNMFRPLTSSEHRAVENWICVLSVYEIQSANVLAIKCNSKFVLSRCTWHHALPAEWVNGDNSVEQAERQTTDIQRPLTLTAHHRLPFYWAMTWISVTLHRSQPQVSLKLPLYKHNELMKTTWQHTCSCTITCFKCQHLTDDSK